jgi:hypothetical protein
VFVAPGMCVIVVAHYVRGYYVWSLSLCVGGSLTTCLGGKKVRKKGSSSGSNRELPDDSIGLIPITSVTKAPVQHCQGVLPLYQMGCLLLGKF